eukprot:TRINITY_DN49634_c0_g2_i1.p1 TRINITY_DN49634_c0_g2~~TRINITY_DN49634_c0_g2_i1.p1  ORF type:complete len:116 (+),score=3.22 TRINITY_DN49634_c0_g2_i1:37-384(+)
MDKQQIETYVSNVLTHLKDCEDKENFMKTMKDYEDEIYGKFEKSVHDHMLPELQKRDKLLENLEKPDQPYFLHSNNPNDREYLQSFNRINRFHGEVREGETTKHLSKTFQQGQEI